MHILSRVLTVYSWMLAVGLIYGIMRLARFYEQKYAELYKDASEQRTFYQLLWLPMLFFVLAAARYAYTGELAGDLPGDLALLIGGIILALLAYRLYRMMTAGNSSNAGGRR